MKIYFLLIIPALVLASIVTSCEKSTKCWGKRIINEGLIEADTTICSNCQTLANEEETFVVNSQSDLTNVFNRHYGYLTYCEMNKFNFDKYSLLGFAINTSCKYKIRKEVVEDQSEKTYTYNLYVRECGSCISTDYLPNWVLIPKIKPGYSVKFQISRI